MTYEDERNRIGENEYTKSNSVFDKVYQYGRALLECKKYEMPEISTAAHLRTISMKIINEIEKIELKLAKKKTQN